MIEFRVEAFGDGPDSLVRFRWRTEDGERTWLTALPTWYLTRRGYQQMHRWYEDKGECE